MINERGLIDLKERISEASEKAAQTQGKLAGLLERLTKDYDCPGVKEAEAKLKTLKAEQEDIEDQIDAGIEEIESMKDAG